MRKEILTDKAPAPIGPYSQAILAQGKLLYISGQIPMNVKGEIVGDNITLQTKQVIKNIAAIIEAAGGDMINIVKTTCLLSDMENFGEFNLVYSEYFSESNPARATYGVNRLPKDVLVEIEAVAIL
ncbi:MAG: RidA family protein [Candidatus Kapabacteria bacterium]|nr:RidA family protein [Candidatus Kapabacteria bacterium]